MTGDPAPSTVSGPADLYFRTRTRGLGYLRFESTAAAIEHARLNLTPAEYTTCVIETAELRLQVDKQGAFVRSTPEEKT